MISETASTATTREFQQLKTRLHREMIAAIDLSKAGRIPAQQLHERLHALAAHVCGLEPVPLEAPDRERMVRELMDEIYGFGPLQSLMNDPKVTDILVNGPERVFAERGGLLEPTEIQFADEAHLMAFIHRMVGQAGRRIDEVSPMVDAKLPDGSRLNAVIPPLALRGPTVSIRRFRRDMVNFEEMLQDESLTPEIVDFLTLAVEGRINILISGGTGAGKTTLLNNLGRFIPASERVVTIEETAELQLQQDDVVALETRPANVEGKGAIGQRELLRNSLRMRPDRIIVGETRGAEVLEMLQAMNTGHDGSMCTIHANDTRDALDRLELMIALSEANLPTHVARQYIGSAVQIIVHVMRLSTGERKIMRISELRGYVDGVFSVEDIYVYRMLGVNSGGRAEGAFYATGYSPSCVRRLISRGVVVDETLFNARELTANPPDRSES